jgi:membrane-bound serine protease (ClpP class)
MLKIFTRFFVLATFLYTLPLLGGSDSTSRKLVYQIDLNQEIMPAAWRLIQESVANAEAAKADVILIRLNTYGGRLDVADSIRTRLLNAKPTTIVHIDKNAASAGALISIACDSIYMVSGATIGAATVVDQEGTQLPDKYQSYMRGMMRATAEAKGRDPAIAEGMVDDRVSIEGVTEEGKVITFTVSEAIEHGFCDGEIATIPEVLKAAGVNDYELVVHELSTLDEVIHFLLNPVVSSLLLMLIFGGVYFELQTPIACSAGRRYPLLCSSLFGRFSRALGDRSVYTRSGLNCT